VSDRAKDWHFYQMEFKSLAEQFGEEKAATVPSGVQQIWVADLQRADRCTTCHQGVAWKGFERPTPVSDPPRGAAQDPSPRGVRLHLVPRRPGVGH
jgi:hypothetical protein